MRTFYHNQFIKRAAVFSSGEQWCSSKNCQIRFLGTDRTILTITQSLPKSGEQPITANERKHYEYPINCSAKAGT